MSMLDAIWARHSVRSYNGKVPSGAALEALRAAVSECAEKSGLNIQLLLDNPEVFNVVAKFGLIRGAVANVAFVTSRDKDDDEAIGYWGQKIVLVAQQAGLNTCWVGICARHKSKAIRLPDEKVRLVIAVGYGTTQGKMRKTKPISELASVECADIPAWFGKAMEAAQLAPTAVNHQRFHMTLRADGRTVLIEAPSGGLNMIDLGIVKRNFEEAANELGADWQWE